MVAAARNGPWARAVSQPRYLAAEPGIPPHLVASGIYGTIVTAAILSAAGDRLSVRDLLISTLVTLLVYWIAEECWSSPPPPCWAC